MNLIAVGTTDGVTVSEHLARSSSFLLYTIEGGAITGRSVRDRSTDGCGNHRTFVELLDGANAVICGGIGQGAVDALLAHGVQPLVIAGGPLTADEAVARFLAGTLATTDERQCLCGPGH